MFNADGLNLDNVYTVEALIKHKTILKNGTTRVLLRADKVYETDRHIDVKLNLLAYIDDAQVQEYERITLEGEFIELEHEGEFNEFIYYRARKIDYKFDILSLHDKVEPTAFYSIINRIKAIAHKALWNKLPNEEAAILSAMILGDRDNLTKATQELYKYSGIYHILAISGLHISILARALHFIIYRLFRNDKAAYIVTILLLGLYSFITGNSLSVVRALLMYILRCVARILNRDYDLLNNTSIVAMLILMYEPLYLFDIGFLLSFSSVYGIAILREPILRVIIRLKPPCSFFIVNIFASSMAVTLFNTPVIVYNFYYISTYALFINLVILPATGFIIMFAIALIFTSLISGHIAALISGVLYFLLKFYEMVARGFSLLPFFIINIKPPEFYILFIYYFILIALVLFENSMRKRA
jgi:competence protein ComEC